MKNEAIELLKSAWEIAARQGVDTNWEGFQASLEKELSRHPTPAVGFHTARTYRRVPIEEDGDVIG